MKPRAHAWLSSPGMRLLTQKRAHQLWWLCLKAGFCYAQGQFLFLLCAPHCLICPAQPCSCSWSCWPNDPSIWTSSQGAVGEAEDWKQGSWEGSQTEYMRWTNPAVGYLARKGALPMTFHYQSEEAAPPFWWYSGFSNGFVPLNLLIILFF